MRDKFIQIGPIRSDIGQPRHSEASPDRSSGDRRPRCEGRGRRVGAGGRNETAEAAQGSRAERTERGAGAEIACAEIHHFTVLLGLTWINLDFAPPVHGWPFSSFILHNSSFQRCGHPGCLAGTTRPRQPCRPDPSAPAINRLAGWRPRAAFRLQPRLRLPRRSRAKAGRIPFHNSSFIIHNLSCRDKLATFRHAVNGSL